MKGAVILPSQFILCSKARRHPDQEWNPPCDSLAHAKPFCYQTILLLFLKSDLAKTHKLVEDSVHYRGANWEKGPPGALPVYRTTVRFYPSCEF